MSDDFKSRLESAIERGQQRGQRNADAAEKKKLTEEELRGMHTSYRLSLSERIESTIHNVADHFPGFRQESLFGEVGWGAACYRDDLRIEDGKRNNQYSRLELVIRPYNDLRVLDLKGKGTVMNREIFSRSFFEKVEEADVEKFEQLIDSWAIEYAEQYAARSNA